MPNAPSFRNLRSRRHSYGILFTSSGNSVCHNNQYYSVASASVKHKKLARGSAVKLVLRLILLSALLYCSLLVCWFFLTPEFEFHKFSSYEQCDLSAWSEQPRYRPISCACLTTYCSDFPYRGRCTEFVLFLLVFWVNKINLMSAEKCCDRRYRWLCSHNLQINTSTQI